MTNEAKDKLLRDKINTLDPLSGGIVFGREEAWDRLQQRIEQKPARKIAVKYWVAAAAVLLLMICVTAIYNTPSQQVVKNDDKKTGEQNIVAQQTTTEQPVNNIQGSEIPVVSNSVHTANAPVRVRPIEKPAVDNTPEIPVPQDEHIDDNQTVTVHPPAPVTPSPQPMKVIHINDLERKTETPQQAIAFAGPDPTIDVSKLPVVHINEVIRQDVEIKTIRRENRMSFGRRLFFQPSYDDIERSRPQQEDYVPPRNPFKTIFNIEN